VTGEAGPRTSEGYDAWVRATDWLLIGLSLAFVFVLVAPLAFPHLTPDQQTALNAANIAIWLVFLVDYLVRLYLAPERWRFVRTHVIDLLVVAVPFLRPFRLLRLFAILAEFTRRTQRSLAGQATVLVFTVAGVIMTVCAIVVFNVERTNHSSNIKTFPDALWWAVSTVTTVGYGDKYPHTEAGRAVAVVLMLTGIALVGTMTAAIAAWFVGSNQKANRKAAEEDEDQAQAERSILLAEMAAVRTALDEVRSEVARLHHQSRTPNGSQLNAVSDVTPYEDGMRAEADRRIPGIQGTSSSDGV
jgi:voltage-gated potassium channel